MIPNPRIYVSASKDQYLDLNKLAIKGAIFRRLENSGLEPWVFFKRGPLRKGWGFKEANAAMAHCQGAIVLAFAQWECIGLGGRRESGLMPSEGNHFEGGLAIAHGVPLLVVREVGSLERGILSEGPDNQVVDMPRGAGARWLEENPTFGDHFLAWTEEVKSRPRVFLGYCSEASSVANEITLFLERTHKVGVRNYRLDFVPGPTILEEGAKSVNECSCGIFLFTRSDQIGTTDGARAAPRDNVVFEAGYFSHAKGKERTAIILEQKRRDADGSRRKYLYSVRGSRQCVDDPLSTASVPRSGVMTRHAPRIEITRLPASPPQHQQFRDEWRDLRMLAAALKSRSALREAKVLEVLKSKT